MTPRYVSHPHTSLPDAPWGVTRKGCAPDLGDRDREVGWFFAETDARWFCALKTIAEKSGLTLEAAEQCAAEGEKQ
jgi:hypothetical protein